MSEPEQVLLSSLKEDEDVYPRGSVSSMHVDDLVNAIDAGAQLPPPLIDRETRIIVDGFHRVRAWRRRLGDDGVIDVLVDDFGSRPEMLLKSAQLNASHGLALGRLDQKVVIIKARGMGATDTQIASALGITGDRVTRLAIRVATAPDGSQLPVKRGAEHLSGQFLDDAQAMMLRRMRGGSATGKARELTGLLTSRIAPVETDGDLRLALAELAEAITSALAAVREP